MAHTTHVEVSSLPSVLQSRLSELGYHSKDISLGSATEVSPADGGEAGCRSFFSAVDLSTGQGFTKWGSFGGANIFNPHNAVDLDTSNYPIPPNTVVIQGRQGGGRPVYAHLTTHPETLTPLLPAKADVSEREARILGIVRGIKGGPYRKQYLADMKATDVEIDSLVARGLLTKNKAGAIGITTAGKNSAGGVR